MQGIVSIRNGHERENVIGILEMKEEVFCGMTEKGKSGINIKTGVKEIDTIENQREAETMRERSESGVLTGKETGRVAIQAKRRTEIIGRKEIGTRDFEIPVSVTSDYVFSLTIYFLIFFLLYALHCVTVVTNLFSRIYCILSKYLISKSYLNMCVLLYSFFRSSNSEMECQFLLGAC